jgi:hypothetical protein
MIREVDWISWERVLLISSLEELDLKYRQKEISQMRETSTKPMPL